MTRQTRRLVLVGLYAVLLGVLAYLGLRHAPLEPLVVDSAATSPLVHREHTAPVRIVLPDVGIDVPIRPGTYDSATATWTLSTTSAYFATVTMPPNMTAGTTLIYAHNSKNLFGPTADIQPGNQAVVITESGARFTYTYTGEDVVAPRTTDVFTEPADGVHELILLTCSGSWNQKRRLLHFEFTGASL